VFLDLGVDSQNRRCTKPRSRFQCYQTPQSKPGESEHKEDQDQGRNRQQNHAKANSPRSQRVSTESNKAMSQSVQVRRRLQVASNLKGSEKETSGKTKVGNNIAEKKKLRDE